MMKKMATLLLCLMIVTLLAFPAQAATAEKFLRQSYDVDAEAVYCYGKQLPGDGNLKISVGTNQQAAADFSTIRHQKIPVTVYCLVDSATSLSKDVMKQQTDILLAISGKLESQDSMILGAVDKELVQSKPLDDKAGRDAAIQTIQRGNWYTNLYEGIALAIDDLAKSTSYDTNTFLVILSDGHDDGQSSVTADKAIEKAAAAGIPVYSIILGNTASKEEKDIQEKLTAETLGGFVCNPSADGTNLTTAVENVMDSIKGSTAIRVGMESFADISQDIELLVRYETKTAKYEDTILVRAVDLQQVSEGQEFPYGATEEGQNGIQELFAGKFAILLALVVFTGVAAVVVVVVVLVVTGRKKKAAPEAVSGMENPLPNPTPVDIPATGAVEGETDSADSDWDLPTHTIANAINLGEISQTAPVSGGCHVFAVALMHPEIQTDFYLTPKVEMSFGRTSKSDIILCDRDPKLSGLHGSLVWDGTYLLARDRGSTNGTAVNGEPCGSETWLPIEDGAILRAGSYEYRISYEAPKD